MNTFFLNLSIIYIDLTWKLMTNLISSYVIYVLIFIIQNPLVNHLKFYKLSDNPPDFSKRTFMGARVEVK